MDWRILAGTLLLLQWVFLVIWRAHAGALPSVLWLSHLALLVAAGGYLLRNDLLLTGALLAVLVGHGLWLLDFLIILITGSSPWDIASYFFELSLPGKVATAHHLYLLPLLLWTPKAIHPYGWTVAAALLAFGTLVTFLFLEENINCAHHPCEGAVALIPALGRVPQGIMYLIALNVFGSVVAFFLPNLLLMKLAS